LVILFYRLCLILSLLYRTFSHRFKHFLLHFVATHVHALLYWAFSHRFTRNIVAFCRKRCLRTFVKILARSLFFLAGSLFSFPCLSQILSSTPEATALLPDRSPIGDLGPHLGTRVPMRTFFRFWVPIFFQGPHFLYFRPKNA